MTQMRSALVDGLGRGVSGCEVTALLATLDGKAHVSGGDIAKRWYDEAAFVYMRNMLCKPIIILAHRCDF